MTSLRKRVSVRTTAFVLFAVVVVVGIACTGGNKTVDETDIELAQTALRPFKKELRAALRSGLESGPEEAITVCSRTAYDIATRLSRDGVEMGRTSHKLRNPKNAPADWIKPLLDEYVGGSDEPFLAVALEHGRFGYVEPIRVTASCLICHGESVAPALVERISQYYPEDRAVGFANGDFRGLFWVTMPQESKRQ